MQFIDTIFTARTNPVAFSFWILRANNLGHRDKIKITTYSFRTKLLSDFLGLQAKIPGDEVEFELARRCYQTLVQAIDHDLKYIVESTE